MKSFVRTPLRSCLFFVLMFFLSAILILSFVLYTSVSDFLRECREHYQSSAVLEYIGQSYPDPKVYDTKLEEALGQGAVDLEALSSLDGVLSFDQMYSVLGVSGAHRLDKHVYDRELGVITITNLMWDKNGETYMAVISDCLYSQRDNRKKLVFIDPDAFPGGIEEHLKKGFSYILCGHYVAGTSSYLWFSPEAMDFTLDGEEVHVAGWKLLEDGRDYPEYEAAATVFSIQNSSFRVVYAPELERLRPFSEEELTLKEGRLFTEEEKKNGIAAILSDKAAAYLEVEVGDEVSFSLLENKGDLYRIETLAPSAEESFRLVGIYYSNDSYPDWAFISKDHEPDFTYTPTGFTLGQFNLDNDKAETFMEKADGMLPKAFRLTLYDQGYSLTAEPYKDLRAGILFFLILSIILTLALLFLYGFLMVMKDKSNIETMAMLGTGKAYILRFFLVQAIIPATAAASIGALASSLAEEKAMDLLRSFASLGSHDLRFSQSALSRIKSIAFNPSVSPWIYTLGITGVLLAAVVSVLFFLRKVFSDKEQRPRKCRKPRLKERKDSSLYGKFKYPLISIGRNTLKTASVVLVLIASFLFMGMLSHMEESYGEEKEAYREKAALRGYASSLSGLDYDKLVVPLSNAQALEESGSTDTLDYGRSVSNYRLLGIRQKADGTLLEVEEPRIPQTSFAMETFLTQLSKEPLWLSVTDLRKTPEFFYSNEVDVDFLEPFSFDLFSSMTPDVCLIPLSLAEREGIEKGDVIRILCYMKDGGWGNIAYYDFLVVGIFQGAGGVENIYTPFDYQRLGDEVLSDRQTWPTKVEDYPLRGTANGLEAKAIQGAEDCPSSTAIYGSYSMEQILEKDHTYAIVDQLYLKALLGQTQYERYKQNPANAKYLTIEFDDDSGKTAKYRIIGEFQSEPEGPSILYSMCNTAYNPYSGNYGRSPSGFSLRYLFYTLGDTSRLDELRDSLEASGFAVPLSRGEARNFTVIEDRDYLSTMNAFDRQLRYVKALNTFLYAALYLTGILMAFLLIGGRREEIGTMRSLGTPKTVILWSFLGEQLLLLSLTMVAAFTILFLRKGLSWTVGLLILGYTILWFLGATARMLEMMKKDIHDYFVGEE